MANLALSTQIPQIGDSSQQLLARMAAAAADQNQPLSQITWLSSAARTTAQTLNLTPPSGVIGIRVRVAVTSVPGVDTLRLYVLEQDTFYTLSSTAASAAALNHLILYKRSGQFSFPAGTSTTTVGLSDKIALHIEPSAGGSFTYSATYCWLKA